MQVDLQEIMDIPASFLEFYIGVRHQRGIPLIMARGASIQNDCHSEGGRKSFSISADKCFVFDN